MKKRITALLAFLVGASVSAVENPYRLEKLLEMEDVSSKHAVAPLKQILQTGGRSLRPCATAQALFLIDTPASEKILKKYLAYPHYDFDYSIRLAFHWGMEPDKRDEFIRRYHLNCRSKDVAVSLKAPPLDDAESELRFTISLTNISSKPLRIYKPYVYLGKRILIISKHGDVMEPLLTTKYNLSRRPLEETYSELAPGAAFTFAFTAKTEPYPDDSNVEYPGFGWLNCGDFGHNLNSPGEFKVYARYEHRGIRKAPFENIWTGRIISEPITVKIQESSKPNKSDAAKGN